MTGKKTAVSGAVPRRGDAGAPGPIKKWVRRVAEGAPLSEKQLFWAGVEMERFLTWCRRCGDGAELQVMLEGYGRYLRSMEPPLEEWRLHQAREALRLLKRGTENWHWEESDRGLDLQFRVKAGGAERREQKAVGNGQWTGGGDRHSDGSGPCGSQRGAGEVKREGQGAGRGGQSAEGRAQGGERGIQW